MTDAMHALWVGRPEDAGRDLAWEVAYGLHEHDFDRPVICRPFPGAPMVETLNGWRCACGERSMVRGRNQRMWLDPLANARAAMASARCAPSLASEPWALPFVGGIPQPPVVRSILEFTALYGEPRIDWAEVALRLDLPWEPPGPIERLGDEIDLRLHRLRAGAATRLRALRRPRADRLAERLTR